MKLLVSLAIAAMLAGPSLAAPCRDAKGKFTKCPPAAASIVKVDKNGKCHDAKGHFTACPKK